MLARIGRSASYFLQKTSCYRYGVQPQHQQPQVTQLTPNKIKAQALGIKEFMNRVYLGTAAGLGTALSSAYLATQYIQAYSETEAFNLAMGYSIIGTLLNLGCFYAAHRIKPIQDNRSVDGEVVYKTKNTFLRKALFVSGSVGLGLVASPLFLQAMMLNPSIIPQSMAITAGVFGGASLLTYSMPNHQLVSYKRVLFGGFIGLLVVQLLGLGAYLVGGHIPVFTLLVNLQSFVGIALFSGFVIYDTHLALNSYNSGEADHLGISIQFVLDIWNLLLRIMRLVMRNKRK